MRNRTIQLTMAACVVAGVIALAGCAPQASPSVSSNSADTNSTASSAEANGADAITMNWSPDSDCSVCHQTEAASTQGGACLAATHATNNTQCVDCHTDESTLATVHADGAGKDPATKLRKTKMTSEDCLACHEHDSLEAIAERTADVVVTDDQGKAINPHALPEGRDHESLACTACHVSHVATDTLTEARSTCIGCHHAGVFECGTCHE
ncbi:cytochrome c3 family protein [Adlercreutzia aquisgranensis]|uniref:cytochrome c3 family protein n=1 Tax=Adlercreutzia aquisgranensis TaxID=2941323 RepID=UPI00203FA274|nr:cytochrome c3 family protein [Adlercreutzia aquisgranensis]